MTAGPATTTSPAVRARTRTSGDAGEALIDSDSSDVVVDIV